MHVVREHGVRGIHEFVELFAFSGGEVPDKSCWRHGGNYDLHTRLQVHRAIVICGDEWWHAEI